MEYDAQCAVTDLHINDALIRQEMGWKSENGALSLALELWGGP